MNDTPDSESRFTPRGGLAREALDALPCCSPSKPHRGQHVQDLAPGVTHYISTRADGHTRLVENDGPALETPEALRARIDAALEALRIPVADQEPSAWVNWVNQGNGWWRKARDARLALGADR